MILIGVGANLPSTRYGSAVAGCEAALRFLDGDQITVLRRSRWYRSAPVPPSDQPEFVNGVAVLSTALSPEALLARLHAVETAMGRIRSIANAARVIDLDLIDYAGLVRSGPAGPILPHPRAPDRAFVLLPLRDLAPEWRHPVLDRSVDELIRALAPGQDCAPLEGAH